MKKHNKMLLISRAVFTGLFITMMICLTVTKNDKTQVLDDFQHECIRDAAFEWVTEINAWFIDHNSWKNFVIIQSSVCIDFIMVTYLIVFFMYGTSMRLALTLCIFYPTRNMVQTLFLMGRPSIGFLWSWPNA